MTKFRKTMLIIDILLLLIVSIPFMIEEMSEDDILLIVRHQNFSDGYQDYGCYVTTSGEVYLYDFGSSVYPKMEDVDDESLMVKLKMLRRRAYLEPVLKLDEEIVRKLYYNGNSINKNAQYICENVSFDAGQTKVLFCDSQKNDLILCGEFGDTNRIMNHQGAKNIMDLYEQDIKNELDYTEASHLFSEDDVKLWCVHCGYSDEEKDYYVTSKDKLIELGEMLEYDFVKKMEGFDIHTDKEYVFFINHDNKSNCDYDMEILGFIHYPDRYRFIVRDKNEWNLWCRGQMMDGYMYIAAIEKDLIQLGLIGENWVVY